MATVGPKRPRLALPELGVSRRKRAISPSLASARRTDSSEAARLQRKDRLGAVTFSPEASLGGLAHTTRDERSAAGWGMRSKAGSASSSTFGGGSFERRSPASRSGSRPVSPRSRNGPGRKAVDFSWSEFEARIALSSPHIGSGVPPSPASSISASPATRQSPRGTGASPAPRQSPHRRYKYSSSPLTSSPALLTRSRGARAAAQNSLRPRAPSPRLTARSLATFAGSPCHAWAVCTTCLRIVLKDAGCPCVEEARGITVSRRA